MPKYKEGKTTQGNGFPKLQILWILKYVGEKKKGLLLACEGTWSAVINLRKKEPDVRHSPACNTGEQQLEKQDAYVALG